MEVNKVGSKNGLSEREAVIKETYRDRGTHCPPPKL
jgi:hypothetical protein